MFHTLLVSVAITLANFVLAKFVCEDIDKNDVQIEKLPNFVFILGDDIGWNDVGWNNPNIQTPHMNKLAKKGVILDQFYTMPLCTPSRATLLSGLYAQQLGLQRGVLGPQEPYGIPLKYKLLPEMLKKRNYSTHAIGKWHLGYCNWSYTPTFRGFDSFLGFYQGYEENYEHCLSPFLIYDPVSNCTIFDFHKNTNPAKEYNGIYSSYVQNDRAVEIIKQHKNSKSPLFMYVALVASHFPTQGDKFTKQCKNTYDSRQEFCGAMISIDEVVHNITEALKENDLYDNSVLVFVSDNGGLVSFGGNNYPLRGNKGTLWEGGTRVPGFIHSPLIKKTGYTYKGLFHMVDWYPTFLHLAGIKPSKVLSGFSQWESVSNNKPSPRKDFPYTIDEIKGITIGAVRLNDYKLIVGPTGSPDGWYAEEETVDGSFNSTALLSYVRDITGYNLSDTSLKLYNLANDPNEKNNLADEEPDKVAELMFVFDKYYSIAKPAVKLRFNPAGNANNFGGTLSPGWCKAFHNVPTERKLYETAHN